MALTGSLLGTGAARLLVLLALVAASAFVSGRSVQADSGYSLYAANGDDVYEKLKDLKEPLHFSKKLEETFTEPPPDDTLKLKQWSMRYKFHPEAVKETCKAVFDNPKDYPSTTDSVVEVVSRKNLLAFVYLTQELIDSNFATEDFQASVFSALTSGRFTKDDNLVIAYGPQDGYLPPASLEEVHGGYKCAFWMQPPNWKLIGNGLNPVNMIIGIPEPILPDDPNSKTAYPNQPIARTRKFSLNAYDACLRFARPNTNPNFLENYFDIGPDLTQVAKEANVYGLVPALLDYLSDTAQDTIWRAAMRHDSVKAVDIHETNAEFEYMQNDTFARRMIRRSNVGIMLGLRFKLFAESSLNQMGCINSDVSYFSPDSDPDAHQYLMIFADSSAGLKEFGNSVLKSPKVREQLTKSTVGINLKDAKEVGQVNMIYPLRFFSMRDAGWKAFDSEYLGGRNPQSLSMVNKYYSDSYTERAKELPYCYYESYYHTYLYHSLQDTGLIPETALERLLFVRKTLEILNVKKVVSVEMATKSSLIPEDEPSKELSFLRNSYMSLVLGCPKLLPDPSLASKSEKARSSLCMRGGMRNQLDEDYGVEPGAKCYSLDANTVVMDRDVKRCLKEYYEIDTHRNLYYLCSNPENSKECKEEGNSEFDLAPYTDIFMGLYTSFTYDGFMKFSKFPSLYDTMIKSHMRASNKKRVVAKDLKDLDIYDSRTYKLDKVSGKTYTVQRYDFSVRHACNSENVDSGTLTNPLYVNEQSIFNQYNEAEDINTNEANGYYVWHRGVYTEKPGSDESGHITVLDKINVLDTVKDIHDKRNTLSPSFSYPVIDAEEPYDPEAVGLNPSVPVLTPPQPESGSSADQPSTSSPEAPSQPESDSSADQPSTSAPEAPSQPGSGGSADQPSTSSPKLPLQPESDSSADQLSTSAPETPSQSEPDSSADQPSTSSPEAPPQPESGSSDNKGDDSATLKYVAAAAPIAFVVAAGSILFVRQYRSRSQKLKRAQELYITDDDYMSDISGTNVSRSYLNAAYYPPRRST